MKGKMKKIAGLLLAAACITSSFASCGGGNDPNTITFWYTGSEKEQQLYVAYANKFNETYGAEHDIKVVPMQRPVGSYDSNVQITAGSDSGPDVFLVRSDDSIKTWIVGHYMADITDEFAAITDIDLGDLSLSAFRNARYNRQRNTSYDSDPLYGVPVNPKTTAIYYNIDLMKAAGVICISVDEENLEKWSKGEIDDNNGLNINDAACAKLKTLLTAENQTMPSKGFFRSENVYYYDEVRGSSWVSPTEDEVLVFNDRIPMNWDETEDLAMLFTGSYNPKKGDENKTDAVTPYGTTYGYFTEWWFNYGWSVGGDCLVDLSGNGDWSMGLLDPNPNYVVKENATFTSRTGTTYQAGEIISFWDKMNIADGEILKPEDYGDFYKADGTTLAGIHSSIITEMEKEDGALAELPSMRTAFNRYLKLGASKDAKLENDESGLKVSPNPLAITQIGLSSYFLSKEIAFCASTSDMVPEWAERATSFGFEFGIAPLSVYKEYEDPSDPFCDEVVVQGKKAGHVNNITLAVREGSKKIEKATAFLKWTTSLEGQKLRASKGFYPMQQSLAGEVKFAEGENVRNVKAFSEAATYQTPGDWWYMPDCTWVQRWCTDLNASLRNGLMTYQEWLDGTGPKASTGGKVVVRTNEWLNSYEIEK